MVNIRHLRAFLALAEHRHFTRAAEQVCISQSAFSALIQQLEADCGVTLFDRSTRSVEPTAIGLEFYDVVKTFLDEFDASLLTLSEYGMLKRGRVTCGTLPSLAATILPDIVAGFKKIHPEILVNIIDAPGEELGGLLRSGQIDMALSHSASSRDIESIPLFNDRLVLVGKLKTAKATDRTIAWVDLGDEPIIAMVNGTTIRALIDAASAQAGIQLNTVLTPRLIPTALAFARSELGCAILPSSVQSGSEFANLPQYELVEPSIRREIALMRLKSSARTPAAEAFANHLSERICEVNRH